VLAVVRLAGLLSVRSAAERKARDELRAAIAGAHAAEVELQTKAQAVQRLRQVIQDADTAVQAADAAEQAATAGATAWAQAGAVDEDTEHRALIAQALEARTEANVARIRATGAQQALPAAEESEERAKRVCEQAAEKVCSADGAVLVALVQPTFERLWHARDLFLEAFNEIRGALATEDLPGWHGPFRRNLASGLSSLADKLNELAMPTYTTRGGHRTDAPGFFPDRWAKLAKRLATDPDAIAADVDED
jgi:hypothetical protein